jgi:hypothetical protein
MLTLTFADRHTSRPSAGFAPALVLASQRCLPRGFPSSCPSLASPAIAGGTLYIRTESKLDKIYR